MQTSQTLIPHGILELQDKRTAIEQTSGCKHKRSRKLSELQGVLCSISAYMGWPSFCGLENARLVLLVFHMMQTAAMLEAALA